MPSPPHAPDAASHPPLPDGPQTGPHPDSHPQDAASSSTPGQPGGPGQGWPAQPTAPQGWSGQPAPDQIAHAPQPNPPQPNPPQPKPPGQPLDPTQANAPQPGQPGQAVEPARARRSVNDLAAGFPAPEVPLHPSLPASRGAHHQPHAAAAGPSSGARGALGFVVVVGVIVLACLVGALVLITAA